MWRENLALVCNSVCVCTRVLSVEPEVKINVHYFFQAGASRSESWRPDVDRLIITVAANACKSGFSKEGNSVFLPSEPLATWADFQLAALRALLASIISPARVRPPYLAQGLELFHRGNNVYMSTFCI